MVCKNALEPIDFHFHGVYMFDCKLWARFPAKEISILLFLNEKNDKKFGQIIRSKTIFKTKLSKFIM